LQRGLRNVVSKAMNLCEPQRKLCDIKTLRLKNHLSDVHQRTLFLSSQAFNLLSFVAKEPHCLEHAVPWNLDICS